MIKTKNFLIERVFNFADVIPFSKKETLLFNHHKVFNVFDLTGKGGKFVLEFSPEHHWLHFYPVATERSPTLDEDEILAGLSFLSPKIFVNRRTLAVKKCAHPQTPSLAMLTNRNQKLESLLASFNWLEFATIKFHENCVILYDRPRFFQHTLYYKRLPSPYPDEVKSFFVENEIYENHLIELRELAEMFYNDYPGSIYNVCLIYEKGKGLV